MEFRVHCSVRDVSPIYAHALPTSHWTSCKYLPCVMHTFKLSCKIHTCDESMIASVTATPALHHLLIVSLPSLQYFYFFLSLPFLFFIPIPFHLPLFNRVHMALAVTVAEYPG